MVSGVQTGEWCRKGRAVCELGSSARTDNYKGYQFPYRSLTHSITHGLKFCLIFEMISCII